MFDHPFDFDPTCGYSRADLLRVTPPEPEPEDFEDFWKGTYQAGRRIPLNLQVRPLWAPRDEGLEAFEVKFDSWGGVRVGAWVVRPKESAGGVVFGHGYGGRQWFDLDFPRRGFTCLFLHVRGFGLSAHEDIPWQSAQHVLHGIESRETYVLRGAAADFWQAATALCEMYPDVAGNLNYFGGSFGGGMGALMLPWEARFRAAYLRVPTFGHHPLRLKFKSKGSAESVRRHHEAHPEADLPATLAYFDSATAAKRIGIPVLCAPALFDPSVVPPGQFAVANALNDQSKTVVLPAGHFPFPGEEEVVAGIFDQVEALFKEGAMD